SSSACNADVISASLVHHRQRADGLVDAIGDDEMLEVLCALRGFRQQASEVHAERSVGIEQPYRYVRQREGKPQREARGKAHGAVHVKAVLALGRRPPFVRRHPKRAHANRLAAMPRKHIDGIARSHADAPSPFTSLRVRKSTNGRFCSRQVSKASAIWGMSSARSIM